ncbi:sensor histidine kinase [Mycolicibacterium sp. YH-1]|uniref:sensor histidine kinase n=1 Tax=Mycolicibacterium sp. YH-1 TaxID=2908837 RepID=UPI001F4C3E9A|nr:histidine kinase [Mycolicibacterium sp. YH-1]UNB53162.1 histidine kinase [Mycolicibacterium sp. YH-1]
MTTRLAAFVRAHLLDLLLLVLAAADAVFEITSDEMTHLDMAFAVVAVAVLCFRRRAPYLVLIATLPALEVGSAVVAALVALYTVAELRPARVRLALCAVALFACYTSYWYPTESKASAVLDAIYALMFAGAPVVLGLLVRARAELAAKLTEIDEARQHEQELLVDKALARERADLAREMHDVVSHQVSLIAVQAGALQVTAKDDASAQTARVIRTLSVQTLDELRDMVGVLRASGSRDTALTPQSGIDDLPALVSASGIATTIEAHYGDSIKPTPAVERAIYRAAQEGLTNIAKHAPGATATLELHVDARLVRLTLTNTKATSDPDPWPSNRNGLLGLRERAELLGGALHADHLTDGGYRLSILLPPHI